MKKMFKRLMTSLIILAMLLQQNIFALSFDKKIGMNGHIDVPKDILLAGGVVREYHNFGWSITNNKQMFFERFSWWDFDGYYKFLSENGITILPCIQMGEQAVFNRNRNEKPVMKGDDTTDPMSYKIHANYLFNYAARYGSTVVPKEKLNLDPKDTYKSGLGYITYYEDWNEPDKTWQGPDAQFNSTELAAMLSADYDGHEGKLGDVYGIKQADPNAKLVMGGMAGGSTMVKWLNEMQEWANKNRTDKKLPLDVINYHQYAGTHSPENSSFVSDAMQIINWRNQNAKDKEIWITEFGWDTNLGSTKHAAPTENAQRDWIIREYLIGDRIGLDRMTVYDALNDGPSSDTTQYSTSGLATKVSEGTVKKSSWYGVNTAKNTLKGYSFVKVIEESKSLYIYLYSNGINNMYVLWSPTEDGSRINDYSLNIGEYSKASLTELKDKEALGVTTSLNVVDNSVKVNVSESPIFVKVSEKVEKKPIEEEKKPVEEEKKTVEEEEKPIEEEKKSTEEEKKPVEDNNINNEVKVITKEEKTITTTTKTITKTTTKTVVRDTIVNDNINNDNKTSTANNMVKIDYDTIIKNSDKPYKNVDREEISTDMKFFILVLVEFILLVIASYVTRNKEI